ncbi:hypothetical protein GC070_11670 [Neisseria meningitidis]|nr:hypothetical protein [Neisseria meningitidis]
MDFVTGTWVMAAVGLVLVIVARIYLKTPKNTCLSTFFIKPAEPSFRFPKAKLPFRFLCLLSKAPVV